MLKLLLLLVLGQFPTVPLPPDPIIISGNVLAHPNLAVYTAALIAQPNALAGTPAALLTVRQDAEARVIKAFHVFSQFPNTYASVLAGCQCGVGDAAFWSYVSTAFVTFRTQFPNTYKATMLANKIKLSDDTF